MHELSTIQTQIEAASTEVALIAIVNGYVGSLAPHLLWKLPPCCSPGYAKTREQLALCAYTLAKATTARRGDQETQLLVLQASVIFTQASERCTQLYLDSRQHAALRRA